MEEQCRRRGEGKPRVWVWKAGRKGGWPPGVHLAETRRDTSTVCCADADAGEPAAGTWGVKPEVVGVVFEFVDVEFYVSV